MTSLRRVVGLFWRQDPIKTPWLSYVEVFYLYDINPLCFSGNLYHNGELPLCLPPFTQGDYITVILDMESRTLSFAKNRDDPVVAFEQVDGCPLYPCVVFYSTNSGEKVCAG